MNVSLLGGGTLTNGLMLKVSIYEISASGSYIYVKNGRDSAHTHTHTRTFAKRHVKNYQWIGTSYKGAAAKAPFVEQKKIDSLVVFTRAAVPIITAHFILYALESMLYADVSSYPHTRFNVSYADPQGTDKRVDKYSTNEYYRAYINPSSREYC